ncbi:MAG TPA: 12-oxophytodienoate reductase [Alcanivorax sp.]|nr:12-oxophytodienoate reductase [Alcanivorax sp.]
MTVTLDQPLELPCGATLKNRLGKSAMSETLGTTDNRVTAKLTRLYRAWARGGTGLSVTGNVMIDRRALGEPCNVVLEDRRDMDRLKAWARAGRENGTHLWMQINHPGKQAPAALNRETVSPSAVPFSDPNLKRFFHVPRALTVDEIADLVRRFGETAALAKEAGFSGVQIHGAHGYLIDQFFWSGLNDRNDRWGGPTIADRARFGAEVVKAVREGIGEDMALILRISQWKSHDFAARNGHDPDELAQWLAPLSEAGVDVFHGSQRRFWEPEFEGSDLNFAGWIKKLTGKPTITVGSVGLDGEFIAAFGGAGSKPASLDGLIDRLEREEFDLVAVGRALLADPYWVQKIRDGRLDELKDFERSALATLS